MTGVLSFMRETMENMELTVMASTGLNGVEVGSGCLDPECTQLLQGWR